MSARTRLAAVAMIVVSGMACSNPTIPEGGDSEIAVAPVESGAPPSSHEMAESQPIEIGPTAQDEHVRFTISLNLRDADGLAGFLERLNDPESPDFQRYLTATAFGERFG